ncbi:RsmD family RNA methyltransferase, partial [Klebsiella aerogenes]
VDIVSGDAFAWLARQPDAALDAVFIDPPFAQDWTLRALEAAARVVKPGGVIYVEAAQQLADVSADSHGGEPAAGIGLPADLV